MKEIDKRCFMITDQLVKLKDKGKDELLEMYHSVEDTLKYNQELLFNNYENNSYYIGKYIYEKLKRIRFMLEYGHIDIDVTFENLNSLVFEEEVICYKQIPILETYYNEHNSKILEISEENVPNWMFDIEKFQNHGITHIIQF